MPVSLILLPGLDGTGVLFKPLVAALPPHIRPVVLRYPGNHHLTYGELMGVVRNVLPADGPYILLGESFSGPLAAMLAAENPRGLAGLILCASFVTPPQRLVRPLVPILSHTPLLYLWPIAQRVRSHLEGFASAEMHALFAEMHRYVRPHVIAARLRMVFRTDASNALRGCPVPALYMLAERDTVVPHRNARLAQTILPSMRIERFRCSHQLLQTRPVESAKAIADFAAALGV